MSANSSFYCGIGSCALYGAMVHFQNFQIFFQHPIGVLSALQGFLNLFVALYEIIIATELMGIGNEFEGAKLRELVKNVATLFFFYGFLCLVNTAVALLVNFNILSFICQLFLSTSILSAGIELEKNPDLILNPLHPLA